MADLNINNGQIFLENRLINACISIENGKIIAICKEESLPAAHETIDASSKIVLPGGIDVHTHLLDLVYSYRETFTTGTQAAASGGITTIFEMPLGIEGKTALEAFDMQLNAMKHQCLVDYGIIGAAGHISIDAISEFAHKGAIAFKTFMIDPSEEEAELKDLAAKNDYFLIKIFSEIAKTGLVSCVHAENDAIIANEIERLTSIGK
ncbi:MAG: amidohydrolase family protein, partial [Candidatus Hodarchaeota archaeon]